MSGTNPRFWRRLVVVSLLLLAAVGLVAGALRWPAVPQAVYAKGRELLSPHAADAEGGHDLEADEHDHHAGETAEEHENAGETADEHAHEAADEHDHEHEAAKTYDHRHDAASALELSSEAQKTIGVRLTEVDLRPFERTITVPGMIVERPGWTTLEVTAPMTGVITRIYPIQGEAVRLGQPLFEVRLTHEDLLQVQTEFLRTVEELDVVQLEIARLEKVAADGAIAGKAVLERKYEQQKLEGVLRTQRQALLLHGLTDQQIDQIVSKRTLLQTLTISAPAHENAAQASAATTWFQVQELKVSQGSYVEAGTVLCRLADHAELYVEGSAFEQDTEAINRAAAQGATVSASLGPETVGQRRTVEGLKILYLDDQVDAQSRIFRFYVSLPNRLVRENSLPDGRRFVYWQFRPGQRTEVKIPVERWPDRIVLPVDAVAQDGAESYVFEFNDGHFDRRPVHVEYRDQDWVVIANDGALCPGAMVSQSAAHQMQVALKNKSGGAVDPHAGHNH